MAIPDRSEPQDTFPKGQIPFRIRLGVIGHRQLDEDDPQLVAAVRTQVARIAGLVEATDFTAVKLSVATALAEGGDRIVTRAVRDHDPGARIEVVLPLEDDEYAFAQGFADDPARRAAFDELVEQAWSKHVLTGPWTKVDATVGYEAVGRHIVWRCDILVALWDGKAQRGRGGTAPTLLAAAEFGKPCVWIPSEGEEAGLDNLRPASAETFLDHVTERVEGSLGAGSRDLLRKKGLPHDTLGPLRESFKRLDSFNRRHVDEDTLTRPTSVPGWASAPHARAGALARRFQRWFFVLTWLMAALATGAAFSLGLGLSFYPESLATAIAEIACIVLLFLTFAVVKLARLHERWLSCRLLAERLRTAGYVAPTGFDSLGSVDLQAVFVDESAADWSIRAFEEIWEARPRSGEEPRDQQGVLDEVHVDLQHILADRWIQGQIDYHEAKRGEHARYRRWLTSLIVLLFAGTFAFPVIHAIGTERKWAILCSITLPIAGASLGAILTVRQHHALAERYRRMRGDLIGVQTALLDAKTPSQLREAASEAARVVASEAGDWFGAMWFLDVDHPG